MIRRFLDRHVRRALLWEQHVDDALDLFVPDPGEQHWVDEFTLGDALFLDEYGIEL